MTASLRFVLSPSCHETYSPSIVFHLWGEKVTWGHVRWIGGLQHLRDLTFRQEVWTRWYKWAGALSWCSCQLPHTTQVAYAALHHTANRELWHSTLDNCLTIWCMLVMNNAFVIEENCQHYCYLALNWAFLFGRGDPGDFHHNAWAFVSGHTHRPKNHHW
jgi:hypothetical protein